MEKKQLKLPMGKKELVILAAALLVGIFLLVFPFGKTDGEATDGFSAENYAAELEKRVKKLCESVEGVREPEVLLTLESAPEYVYAANRAESRDADSVQSSLDYVLRDKKDGDETVPVTRICPKVRGVAVVCRGEVSSETKRELTELLSAALGVRSNRIKVS